MKSIVKIAMIGFIACSSSLYADLYDEMITAIKESNCERVQEIVQLTSFPVHEQKIFLNLANEVLNERILNRENRRFEVRVSLALKVLIPFIRVWGLVPSAYLDPRGLAAVFAIPPAIVSPLVLATFAVPFVENIRNRDRTIGISLLGALSCATTYGLIKLEKYFWKRAAEIDLTLDQAIERAGDCKNLLIKLF